MDLKKFLLLPLTYVESVWKCLNTIKNKTNKSNCDYIPINTVLQSLEIYVQKSKINLTKYSINEDDDGDFSNLSSSSSSTESSTESIELTSDDSNNRFKSIIMDGYDFSKLNSKFLIYSSKVNYRSLNKKWDKVSFYLSLSLYSLILILFLFFFFN
jgi:hypothetical protein